MRMQFNSALICFFGFRWEFCSSGSGWFWVRNQIFCVIGQGSIVFVVRNSGGKTNVKMLFTKSRFDRFDEILILSVEQHR